LLLKNKYFSDSLFNKYKNLFLNNSTLITTVHSMKMVLKLLTMKALYWEVEGMHGNSFTKNIQSYGYWSSQAHNYPLQLSIETGLIGLFIFLTANHFYGY
jgi:hypothetical protein